MTNEELILERLDRIEAQIAPMAESAKSLKELKDDLFPLANQSFKLAIKELEEVEASFELQDVVEMIKRFLRNVRNLSYSLDQLENITDFVRTVEPLLKATVPQLINYLDDLDQKGVFRTYAAMLEIRAKVASAYQPEDILEIGDAFVSLLGVLKKLGQPEVLALLERLAEVPADLDLSVTKGVGPMGMLTACSGGEVKQGLGVMLELTKALGKMKNKG